MQLPHKNNRAGELMARTRLRWWKLIAIWVCFLLLHFSYDWFPNIFFRVVSAASETVFLHMKILFVTYLLVSLVEYWIGRGTIRSASSFFASRGLVAVAYPWLTITFWFLAWAAGMTFGRVGEILYANIMTLLGVYLALRLEETLDIVELRPALKWTILLVFLAAIVTYVSFSLHPPLDFFTTPLS
jgi:hypothetical protein